MSTLLQEILTEQEVLKQPPGYSTGHKKNCSCLQCAHGIAGPGHKAWRQRRNARHFRPADNCKTGAQSPQQEMEQEQFLGDVLGTAVKIGKGLAGAAAPKTAATKNANPANLSSVAAPVPKSTIVSIGKRQRAALVDHWQKKFDRARSEVVKARYKKYIDAINQRTRPSWHQSEKDLQMFFRQLGMPGQRTFLANQPAKWIQKPSGRYVPPVGSVIPDINPADAMIEVKNYNIDNKPALIRNLQQQIGRRMQQGPLDSTGNPLDQKVILDMRGQKADYQQLQQLAQDVSKGTGLAPQNIQVVTWEM